MLIREIKVELVNIILDRIGDNGLLNYAIRNRDPRLCMVLAAEALVGVQEETGKNDGEIIRLIQETVGDARGEPYCIGGIMSCIAFAEAVTGIKSPIKATEHARTLFATSTISERVKKIPLPGAIALWGDRGKYTGHGEIVKAADEKKMHCIGFNTYGATSPDGPVEREGNGIYYTVRSYESTASRVFLGCIKPF